MKKFFSVIIIALIIIGLYYIFTYKPEIADKAKPLSCNTTSCMSVALQTCSPANLYTGEVIGGKLYEITGAKGANCIVHYREPSKPPQVEKLCSFSLEQISKVNADANKTEDLFSTMVIKNLSSCVAIAQ